MSRAVARGRRSPLRDSPLSGFNYQLTERLILFLFLTIEILLDEDYEDEEESPAANRPASASATGGGTKASTLPPSRAISFTMRELR